MNGIKEELPIKKDYAILTDEISIATFDISTEEHKTPEKLSKN